MAEHRELDGFITDACTGRHILGYDFPLNCHSWCFSRRSGNPDDLYRHHPAHLAPAIYISRIWIHPSWNPGSHTPCASRWLAESRIRITRIRIRHESSVRSNHDPFHGVRPRRYGLWCLQGPTFDIELDNAVRL